MKYFTFVILLVTFSIVISHKLSSKSEAVPIEEYLRPRLGENHRDQCYPNHADINTILPSAKQVFLANDWEGQRGRKSFYNTYCGCPGISAYTDNKRIPFKYMQCCLRNAKNCLMKDHAGIYTVIDLISQELASSKCRGTLNFRNRGATARDGYLYRGADNLYGASTKIGAVWKYLAFTSFSYDRARAAGYSNKGGEIKTTTFLIRMKGRNELRGLFMENCSLYPKEKEFLVDRNSCFKVTGYGKVTKIKWTYYEQSGTSDYNVVDIENIDCPADSAVNSFT